MDNGTMMRNKCNLNNLGFTLVELLIAMAITSIIAAGIFSAYRNQQDAQLAQKQIVQMQQNLRAALYIMTTEIMKAGYDPEGTNNAGITNAGNGTNGNPLGFTFFQSGIDSDGVDNDNDGVIDEAGELQLIQYDLYDAYSDGDDDIGRRAGAANRQAIAENIRTPSGVLPGDPPLFQYLDGNGAVTSTISAIRAVKITITATTDINEKKYTKGNRTLTAIVKCRNLGLQN